MYIIVFFINLNRPQCVFRAGVRGVCGGGVVKIRTYLYNISQSKIQNKVWGFRGGALVFINE